MSTGARLMTRFTLLVTLAIASIASLRAQDRP